jgi:hypothetical protein
MLGLFSTFSHTTRVLIFINPKTKDFKFRAGRIREAILTKKVSVSGK